VTTRSGRVAAVALAALGVAGCGRSDDPGAGVVWRAAADRDTLAVGDPLVLTVQGRWPGGTGRPHLRWGVPGDSLLLVAVDSARVGAKAGREGWDYRVRLVAPRPGRVRLPGAALVAATGETLALSKSALVRVGGRLPPGAKADLRPLAPMVSLRRISWWMIALGGAVLIAAAVVFFLLRRRRAALVAVAEPPPLPPEVEFEEAIVALAARDLPGRGEVRAFAQELSWILRRYLGRRWEQPALASTRPEIVSWLPDTRLCVRDQGRVASWLEETDRIKFAGHRPLPADANGLLEAARAIVARNEELFAPPPEVVEAAAGGEG
jgi:hypothetical protein